MSSSDSNELMFNLSSSSDSDKQEKKEAPKEEKELEMVKTLGDPRELEDELAKMSMEEIRKNLARQEGRPGRGWQGQYRRKKHRQKNSDDLRPSTRLT